MYEFDEEIMFQPREGAKRWVTGRIVTNGSAWVTVARAGEQHVLPPHRVRRRRLVTRPDDKVDIQRARRLQELREEHAREQQALLLEYKQKALSVAPFLYGAQGFKDPELRPPLSSGRPNCGNVNKTRKTRKTS